MAAARFLVREAAIAALLVEGRHRARFARGFPRFVDRERFAGAVVPVIRVIADRDDDLVARHVAHRARDRLLEPVLRRDRAGLAADLMLVIRHQHDAIDDLGEGADVPGARFLVIRRADRHRDADHPVALGEARARLAQECLIIELALGRQLLEIEERAPRPVRREPRLERIEEFLAQLGIAQQRFHPRRVPFAADRILDHRQDQRARAGAVDDLAPRSVAEHGDVMVHPRDRDPARHQPVELADIAAQRCGRAFVPRHMEGDRERLVDADAACGRAEQAGIAAQAMPRAAQQRLVRRRQFGIGGVLGLDRQQRRARHRADRDRERGHRHHHEQHERRDRHREPPAPAPRGIVENGRAAHAIGVLKQNRLGSHRCFGMAQSRRQGDNRFIKHADAVRRCVLMLRKVTRRLAGDALTTGYGAIAAMVGAIGFEPTTPGPRDQCATRLRHAPTHCRAQRVDRRPPTIKRKIVRQVQARLDARAIALLRGPA